MPSLLDLQRDFRRALLEGAEDGIAVCVLDDGLTPAERIAVYRNNVTASLTAVLKETFPAICRLVDERFFDYAAHEFIKRHPPRQPCLIEYGAAFPDFLAAFPPCTHLVYLADTARLEWLMSEAARAADMALLAPAALQGIAEDDTPRLTFRFHPSVGYLASPWPIDRIWQANRPGTEGEETIDLGSGGVRLEVCRQGEAVVYRLLAPPVYAFRRALAGGMSLERATEAALAEEKNFDLTDAFAGLFRGGVIVGFALD